ncbi:hypothetical protein LZ554_003924 [Drepanopeziza brunnea f. sp. 'monogermtubi']|nr:hypothetical protein LZ554_003924 [Drepanopeziza brunnea f. sp. 'monogermtubi']
MFSGRGVALGIPHTTEEAEKLTRPRKKWDRKKQTPPKLNVKISTLEKFITPFDAGGTGSTPLKLPRKHEYVRHLFTSLLRPGSARNGVVTPMCRKCFLQCRFASTPSGCFTEHSTSLRFSSTSQISREWETGEGRCQITRSGSFRRWA